MEIIDGSIMSCVVVYAINFVVDTSHKFVIFVNFSDVGSSSFIFDCVHGYY